ncbi:MAG: alcohol dehydrogenase catalytic domain-containing protein [Anaerolineae bacterium]|nr:alcohol dehydrogenase catalytic domain-containing protein [Anaerolineae bacterium]
MDKLEIYKRAVSPLPLRYQLWPLYGAGFENMGVNGKPIEVPMPSVGSDELLIRHDACGLCFSDTKVIDQGEAHPRIQRDMKKEPVVLGHEVCFTVVDVGENLRGQYRVGDRFTLETDIVYQGVGMAYGYLIQGGLSQYSIIDQRIMQSDHGNYLIAVSPERSYAEIALAEPWACVVAAYRLEYRTGIKAGGTLWVIGSGGRKAYTISAGFDEISHPARLMLTNIPEGFASWLKARARQLGVEVLDVPDVAAPPLDQVDDIVLLGADADLVEKVSPRLAYFGVMVLMDDQPMPRKTAVDVGRIHYNRWVYLGSQGSDVSAAYRDVPVRSALRPGGRAWFIGAAGPMGRMHVQRAIQFSDPPATIVCTDVSDQRLEELCTSFGEEARAKGVEWICLNPLKKAEYERGMERFRQDGFDDIVVMVPSPAIIADAYGWLAKRGVMNVFAGVARGTLAQIDLSDAYRKDTRVIGHSASVMSDMELVLQKTNCGELSPIRSVAAIGSLSAALEGLRAVKEARIPGKILIYPHIREFPLTVLPDLKDKLPTVFARLHAGREWTKEAEEEFLRLMLP